MDVCAEKKLIKWPRYFRLAKESGFLGISQVVSVLGAFGLVRVLSEYLSPTEYGELGLWLTAASLMNQVVTGGIQNAIGRFYAISIEKKDVYGYFYASSQLLLYASIIVIGIGIVSILVFVFLGCERWILAVVAIIIFSLLSSYRTALCGIQNADRQRGIAAFLGVMDSTLKILVVFLTLKWFGVSTVHVLSAYVVCAIVGIVVQIFFLYRELFRRGILVKLTQSSGYPWLQEMWAFSWPFATWGIFSWLQQSAPRWALELFANTADVGYFSILSQLGYTPIQIVINFILSLSMPVLFSRVGDASCPLRIKNSFKLTKNLVLLGLTLTIVSACVTFFFHALIFQWCVSPEYASVSFYLPWVVLAGGLFAVAQVYMAQLMVLMLPKLTIAANIGSCIVGCFAAYIGSWLFLLPGAIAGLLAYAVIYLIWMVIIVQVSCSAMKTSGITANCLDKNEREPTTVQLL